MKLFVIFLAEMIVSQMDWNRDLIRTFISVTNIFHHIFRAKALDGFYVVFAYF